MIVTILITIIAILLQRDVYRFREVLDKQNIGYSTEYDFWLSIVSMALIFIYRHILEIYSKKVLDKYLADKFQGE